MATLLSMPATFDATPGFPRAHSYNNIPSLANADLARPRTRGGLVVEEEGLPRSASYTSIPTLDTPQFTKELYRVASVEASPAAKSENNGKTAVEKQGGGASPSKEEPGKQERTGRRKSLVARPKSWIQQRRSSTKASSDGHDNSEPPLELASDIPPVPSISKSTRDKTKAVSESFATFARRSWKASSRSPSPSRNLTKEKTPDELFGNYDMNASMVSTSSPRRLSIIQPKSEKTSPVKPASSPPKISRTSLTIQKIKQRPQSVLMNLTTFPSTNSSTSSLPRSSTDNRSTPRTSTDKVPPVPSTDKPQAISLETPPRRDELWSAFRSIENDFTKFQAKTWSLKTNVVRSQLLPFLKNHASHPSNKNLRSEDLDRRITILNKWWRGLLDVLDGRQNQTVSGVDRPVLLEAAVAIMCRPEWRRGSSAFSPLVERSVNRSPDRNSLKRQKSSNSLASSAASQFLVDSIHHNIRSLFIENLTSQMRFVVDKMSLRHAPASLVTFCGKAAAYAFFFVPGVAEVLVRLWKIEAESLRRVATELGLPRTLNRVGTDEVVAAFPSHIHALGWSSARAMSSYLQQPPSVPTSATMLSWDGPWVGRWCGRDSDMFFVFVKHYHILAEEFMPSGLSLAGKARAPGFVLVQAQVLSVLEATIHRQPAAEPPPVTFDEVLAGVDASVATLPSPSNNSTRLMAENRLIMLLRDFISDRPSEYDLARMTFAQIFAKLIEATARKTSVFSHSSCYLLCDFLEEVLVIYLRFQQVQTPDLEQQIINWPFWLQVCKKMLESNNTMTELRLFSFLYAIWGAVNADEQRKEVVCLEWLLTEETFNRYFNHWCPMVRAYYMRLLCWRICRDDGESTELDTKIFSTVSIRLKANWAKYLFLKQTAQTSNILPPSTIPCHPAPGRRLLIIRNDNQLPAASLFVGFDGIISSPTNTSKRISMLAPSKPQPVNPVPKLTTDTPTPSSKKRWTFMGKIIPSTFTTINNEESSTPRASSPTKTLEEARRETALARSAPVTNNLNSESEAPITTSTHRAFSFKFSLEWPQNFQKRDAAPQNSSPQANRRRAPSHNGRDERRLVPPRLPAPAQAWIGTRVPGISKEPGPKNPADENSSPESVIRAKYAGRALAEWMHIVGECNNFTERRRDEGVPSLKWVEVPTLGVDGFRKFG